MNNLSLKASILSTSAWTTVGFFVTQLLRLGSNIVLAALLFEEAFALIAICVAIAQGLHMFSDLGLGPSIIQNKKGDNQIFLDTVWSIQVIRGVALAIICALIAQPIASFYAANDPYAWELQNLILFIAVATLIEGFDSTKIHLSSRNLNIHRLIILQIAAQLASVIVMIAIALQSQSVYALVFGVLTNSAVTTILSHIVITGRNNRFRWDSRIAIEIIHFGKWIFLSTLITFFTMQLDKLVFSRMFQLSEVGVYVIAFNVAILGSMLVSRLVHSVAFPSFSLILNQGGDFIKAVSVSKQSCLAIGAYLTAGLVGCGHGFIETFYDGRYLAAGVYLPILATGAWFATIQSIYGSALLAKGKSNWMAATNAAKVIGFCIILWPAVYFAGLIGAVTAVAASSVIKLFICLFGARRIGLYSRRTELLYTLYWVTVAAFVLILSQITRSYFNIHVAFHFLAQVLLTTLLFSPLLFRAASKFLLKNNNTVLEGS